MIAAYLEHRERIVEPSTMSSSRTALGHLVEHFGPGRKGGEIEQRGYQRLADHMLDSDYQVSTIQTVFNQISAFARWGGLVVPDVDLPDRGRSDVHAFDADERARIREAASKLDRSRKPGRPSFRLMVELGMSMGLRQGEIFAFRWEDIDAPNHTARVSRQLPKDRTQPKYLKDKEARTVLILPEWWAWHRDDAEGFVVNLRGSTFGTRAQRNMIQRVLDTAGLNGPGLGFHALRHAYARAFIEAGGLIQELSVSMGHATVTVTQKNYGHFMKDVALDLARQRMYGES